MASAKGFSLGKWVRDAERLEVSKNLLYFKKGVGLSIDERRLGALEERTLAHTTRFLEASSGEPRALYMMCVTSVGMASTYRQLLKLYDARTSKVVSKRFRMNGEPVNWGSWRQFAARTDDSTARRALFDDFVEKSKHLAPIVKQRFESYRAVLAKHTMDPLSNYLEHEGMEYERLISMVTSLGDAVKPIFRASLARYSAEILGRDAEYFDDFYFFRNRVFRRYEKGLPTKEEPIPKMALTLKRMGLDPSKVKVDSANRKGKSASAFCSAIQVPSDVRISYRRANPLEDFSSVFHEFGHGIHFSSIDPTATFWDRYSVANGVSEVFSIFFETLMHDQLYLTEELGLADEVADDIMQRFRFNKLFFTAFYAANSTLKLRYWRDAIPFEDLDRLYSDLTERFLGIRYPGAYWKLHHVMPEYFLYSPSYLIAAVRVVQLRNSIVETFGERYWSDKKAGKFLHGLMRVGQSVDFGFSGLDHEAYTRSFTER